jgi:hypothetical protein
VETKSGVRQSDDQPPIDPAAQADQPHGRSTQRSVLLEKFVDVPNRSVGELGNYGLILLLQPAR